MRQKAVPDGAGFSPPRLEGRDHHGSNAQIRGRCVVTIPEELIPIAGMLMVLGIVAIVFWFKARERELQHHQDLRIREMEHLAKMKQLEIELEKSKKP